MRPLTEADAATRRSRRVSGANLAAISAAVCANVTTTNCLRDEIAPRIVHASRQFAFSRNGSRKCFCPFQNNCDWELSPAVQAQFMRTIFFGANKIGIRSHGLRRLHTSLM